MQVSLYYRKKTLNIFGETQHLWRTSSRSDTMILHRCSLVKRSNDKPFLSCGWLKGKTLFQCRFSFKRRLKRHKTIRLENDTKTPFWTKKIGVATVYVLYTSGCGVEVLVSLFPWNNRLACISSRQWSTMAMVFPACRISPPILQWPLLRNL